MPGPGGMDARQGPVIYVKNPFKMCYAWITRYRIDNTKTDVPIEMISKPNGSTPSAEGNGVIYPRGNGAENSNGPKPKKSMFESKSISENIKQLSQFRYDRHLDDVEEMVIE